MAGTKEIQEEGAAVRKNSGPILKLPQLFAVHVAAAVPTGLLDGTMPVENISIVSGTGHRTAGARLMAIGLTVMVLLQIRLAVNVEEDSNRSVVQPTMLQRLRKLKTLKMRMRRILLKELFFLNNFSQSMQTLA